MKAVAYSNNDVTWVVWQYDAPIKGCLGFSLHRTDLKTNQTSPLPAWVPFKGQENPEWKPKTTDVWPVQKFNWRDFTAENGGSYQYEIIPMVGSPDQLTPLTDQKLTTNRVDLTTDFGQVSAAFNNGIL